MQSTRHPKYAAVLALLLALLPLFARAGQKVFVAPEASHLKQGEELLHLYVLDLLGGDSMLLRHGEDDLLVDTGDEKHFPQLEAMLSELSADDLTVFNTHPHRDHVGGLFDLTEKVKVRAFYTAFPEDAEDPAIIQRRAVRHLAELGLHMQRLLPGELLPFAEGVEISMMQNLKGANANEQSAMLMIRYREASLLLTADIGHKSQGVFEREQGDALDVDILKAPHHGLENLSAGFLKSTSPELAFITNGSVNSKRTRKTLDNNRIPYLLATRGVIHLSTDGKTWYVEQVPRALGKADEVNHK